MNLVETQFRYLSGLWSYQDPLQGKDPRSYHGCPTPGDSIAVLMTESTEVRPPISLPVCGK